MSSSTACLRYYVLCRSSLVPVSKTTRELLLEWKNEESVYLSSDLKMPQFTVERVVTDHCEESSLIGRIEMGNTY